jgi:hypothetical protein
MDLSCVRRTDPLFCRSVRKFLGLGCFNASSIALGLQRLQLLLSLLGLFFTRLVLATVIIGRLVPYEPKRNPQDEEEPEYVDGLQACQQRKGNVLRDPAFVLLGFPVEFERPNGLEISQDGVEDREINVVTEVAPDYHEDEKVRSHKVGVDVVETFRGLEMS